MVGLLACGEKEPPRPSPQKIKRMFRTMGCTNCHDIRKRVRGPGGPSFEEIAARYPNRPDVVQMLTRRVLEGTKGRWEGVLLEECPAKTGEGYQEYEVRWLIEWILDRTWEKMPSNDRGQSP